MVEPVVCIFPHSDKEFLTPDKLRNFLSDTLSGELRGRYLLGRLGRRDKDFKARVIPGSLVLFRKKEWVVGQATVQTSIRELEPPEDSESESGIPTTYYHEIFFDTANIRVYEEALSVERLEDWTGRKLDPRFYSILGTRRAYEQRFGE